MAKMQNIAFAENFDPVKFLKALKLIFVDPVTEVIVGLQTNRIPLLICTFFTMWVLFIHILGLDFFVFKKLGITILYPSGFLWMPYKAFLIFCCYYSWGLYQVILKVQLSKRLTQIFTEAGLKSALGRLPAFVSDEPLDEDSRRLRLKLRGQSFESFKLVKDSLKSALQVHVDEISENLKNGTVDVLYSYNELTDNLTFNHLSELKVDEFIVGQSRAKLIKENLTNVPHLLIAGQTGGGKSTFLRQLITSLYLKNKKYSFELIDLKGGLEFQLFEKLPRVKVVSDIRGAILALKNHADETIKERVELLKLNEVKDIESFFKVNLEKRKYPENKNAKMDLGRKIIVIDEAAEVFRVNSYANAKDIAQARSSAAKIAAQGRALGVHLVIATQKPNVGSVDGNIKTNLTGRICFRMSDIASSNTILDNKRAAELPNTKGRAVWRSDSEQKEIQAPFLGEDSAEILLEKYFVETDSHNSEEHGDFK